MSGPTTEQALRDRIEEEERYAGGLAGRVTEALRERDVAVAHLFAQANADRLAMLIENARLRGAVESVADHCDASCREALKAEQHRAAQGESLTAHAMCGKKMAYLDAASRLRAVLNDASPSLPGEAVRQ